MENGLKFYRTANKNDHLIGVLNGVAEVGKEVCNPGHPHCQTAHSSKPTLSFFRLGQISAITGSMENIRMPDNFIGQSPNKEHGIWSGHCADLQKSDENARHATQFRLFSLGRKSSDEIKPAHADLGIDCRTACRQRRIAERNCKVKPRMHLKC